MYNFLNDDGRKFYVQSRLLFGGITHPFRVVKRQFGHWKVRYRGLMKNTQQMTTLFALSNLWMARHRLLDRAG